MPLDLRDGAVPGSQDRIAEGVHVEAGFTTHRHDIFIAELVYGGALSTQYPWAGVPGAAGGIFRIYQAGACPTEPTVRRAFAVTWENSCTASSTPIPLKPPSGSTRLRACSRSKA